MLVSGGRATGVRTVDGETYEATRAVIANVTPPQLYDRLLNGSSNTVLQAEARRFRFGRGSYAMPRAREDFCTGLCDCRKLGLKIFPRRRRFTLTSRASDGGRIWIG